MPLIFIHGVNTRMTDGYRQGVAERNKLFREQLLVPLARQDARFQAMSQRDPINPYWGSHGARPRWGHATLPRVDTLGHLGGEEEAASAAEMERARTLQELSARETMWEGEALGAHPEEGRIREAARADLPRFMEAVLAPIIYGERQLEPAAAQDEERAGQQTALLLLAADEVARDAEVQQRVAQAETDQAVLALLRDEVLQRYQQRLQEEGMVVEETAEDGELGALSGGRVARLLGNVGELFNRASNIPGRAATLRALEEWRASLHYNIAQFFGDVFVYLNERGQRDTPGPIVREVLGAIREAVEQNPDEPLIVVTHSMGGNIFYDILTHFAPDLEVDAWISVGGQVGQFEEIKLFRASDPELEKPDRVASLQPRVKTWLNVYDPADPFSFKAEPVFEGAKDYLFKTGATAFDAHSDYFRRPRFYEVLREHLAAELVR